MHTNTKTRTEPKAPPGAAALTAWRERMGYSQRDACKALGCSRVAWSQWETGAHKVPRYIGLACAALAMGMGPETPDGSPA